MKVLLPIDGSECSKATLNWASNFLDKAKTELYLLYVIQFFPETPIIDQEFDEATHILDEAKHQLENQGYNVKESCYLVGAPASSICEYANDQQIEQIIIGSHGRQGLAKFLMGSVSSEVFKHAKQAVLVLNNSPAQSEGPSMNISHIDRLKVEVNT